jgi:hypothetical protein
MGSQAHSLLDDCENFFGPLRPEYRKRIRAYLAGPTVRKWEDIHGIIIRSTGLGKTIWQALIAIDPTFPNHGRTTNLDGRIIEDWERIPTPLEVMRAIKSATV